MKTLTITLVLLCATSADARWIFNPPTADLPNDYPPAFQNIDRTGPDATPESKARRRFLRHAFGPHNLDDLPELLPFCHFSLHGTPENPIPPYRAKFLALNCKVNGKWLLLTW